MDRPFEQLERHFHLPHIRRVDSLRSLVWLRRAWEDMQDNPGASLVYGCFFAGLGYLILSFAAPRPYLFTAAISGFFLVGPVLAAGLYEISRRHDRGEPASLGASLMGLSRHSESLTYAGLLLAFVLIGWERLSAILFALFYHGEVADVGNLLQSIFASGDALPFLAAYVISGGTLALVVFALMAVALPMAMDRDVDLATAMMSSFRAVASNLRAMFLWAGIIVALVAIGFATYMFGLILVLPLLGYASWHAYRDLIE